MQKIKMKIKSYEEMPVGGNGKLQWIVYCKVNYTVLGLFCTREVAEAFIDGWVAFAQKNCAKGGWTKDQFDIGEVYEGE
jgi:hypothetical protein